MTQVPSTERRDGEMRMKLFLTALALLAVLVVSAAPVFAQGGFDQFGYNYQARIFVGTGMSWCEQRAITTVPACEAALDGPYTNDHLVMKWSKGWDDARFHGGTYGPDAWEDNEWNGAVPGGSGEVWHYKIIWVGPGLESSPYWRAGGYPIWGQFEVIMDQGTGADGHVWGAHAIPTGYGVWP
jgi:hypothetical protein